MLFLTSLEQRIIIVSIAQCWPIFYNIFFAYKLLKRSKNRTTCSLSSFFIAQSSAFIILLFSIFTVNTSFSYPLFISGYSLYFFCHSFLVIFSWFILNADKIFSHKLILTLVISYAITSECVIVVGILVNGIRYGVSTNWVPSFTLEFAILSWLYIGIGYLIPLGIITNKILKTFKNTPLKRRINLLVVSLILGICLEAQVILYNWIDNPLYKAIHPFIALPLATFTAYVAYRTIILGLPKN